MPYVIDNEFFPSKQEITAKCQQILRDTPDGTSVAEKSIPFLLSLFCFHDEWQQKSAGRFTGITTQTTRHGTRCFALIRQDGSQIDISFPHAIRLIPSTRTKDILPQKLRDFRSAARNAVIPDICTFRDSALRQTQECPFSGETLNRSNCAVDHIPPRTFDQLLFDFCTANNVNPLEVAVGSEDGTVAVIEDSILRKAWQDYHREHAQLRLITALANLQLQKTYLSWQKLYK